MARFNRQPTKWQFYFDYRDPQKSSQVAIVGYSIMTYIETMLNPFHISVFSGCIIHIRAVELVLSLFRPGNDNVKV
jgi:hypothetical protein